MASYYLKAWDVRFNLKYGIFVSPSDMATRFGIRLNMPSLGATRFLGEKGKKDVPLCDKAEMCPLQDVYDAIVRAVNERGDKSQQDFLQQYDWPKFLAECARVEIQDTKEKIASAEMKLKEIRGKKRRLEDHVQALAQPLEPPKKKARVEQPPQ